MSEPFIAEVVLFAGNFAPRGWAFCAGQLLNISSNDALFSLIGTIYGGDGRVSFGLPDLRGRSPRGKGQGAGLSNVRLGARGGSTSARLTTATMPSHHHVTKVSSSDGTTDVPAVVAKGSEPVFIAAADAGTLNPRGGSTKGSGGADQAFSILNPYLGLNYIIALYGVYPSRS